MQVGDGALSLAEVHSSVKVPAAGSSWYAKVFAFSGLGAMIAVGYMDPGEQHAHGSLVASLLCELSCQLGTLSCKCMSGCQGKGQWWEAEQASRCCNALQETGRQTCKEALPLATSS